MSVCAPAPIPARLHVAAHSSQTHCLLMHGYNALPAELDDLAGRLAADGLGRRILRLPGDEGSGRALAESTWDEWTDVVGDAVTDAAHRSDSVIVIGHSLGAALALWAAVDSSSVSGVVALCPPLRLWPAEAAAIRVARRVVPSVPAWYVDITPKRRHSTPVIEHADPAMPLRPLSGLIAGLRDLRTRLDRVTCPALVVCARHDHVVPWRDGLEAYQRLASQRKELLVLDRSFHAVLHDVEQELVERRVAAFCQSLRPSRDAP